MDFLPILMNIKDQPCLVVGGGGVALRKVKLLLQAGGSVRIISPTLIDELATWVKEGRVEYQPEVFNDAMLTDCVLVIAATDDAQVNQAVSVTAKQRGIPVNVVDAPALCRFIMPSIIDRSPVIIAVSSGGASPVLARLLRAKLETMIPSSYGRLAILMQGFRDQVKQRISKGVNRRKFWEKVLQGPVTELMYSGQDQVAKQVLEEAIAQGENFVQDNGEVYLVGAGPGDPDLLTFRALRLLQQADVVVYDRLVSEPIMALARRDAELIYVGKQRSEHTLPQEEINRLLIRLAQEGKRVLRLKGGDPFVFGRGGEEIDQLMAAGIPFQVVPGITAATGCAAYAGIPLTHRDYAQSVVFATGHLKDNTMNVNWSALVQTQQTIVFYMGLTGAKVIAKNLVAYGMAEATPIALIEQGTTPRQRVHVGTLATMTSMVEQTHIKPPCLLIVGEVVKLREKLAWFTPDSQK